MADKGKPKVHLENCVKCRIIVELQGLKNCSGVESTTELNKREWEVYDWKCIIYRKSGRQKALIRPYASVM